MITGKHKEELEKLKKLVASNARRAERAESDKAEIQIILDKLFEILDGPEGGSIIDYAEKLKTEFEDRRPPMNYNLAPVDLTNDEVATFGKFVDSAILDLISKWMLYQCEVNNDLLVHSKGESKEKEALWRTAVLVYEDWIQFLNYAKAIHKRMEGAEAKKKEVKKKG